MVHAKFSFSILKLIELIIVTEWTHKIVNKISWLICGGTVFCVHRKICCLGDFVFGLKIVFGKVLYSNLEIDNLEFRNHYCN